MSVHLLPAGAPRLARPEDLREALQVPFSAEQLAAITAPLEPGVIIAGAGSGKTTVMAARVVWLVGTGAVQPEQVLGLTFTRKAAAELSARVRGALSAAGVVDDRGVDESGEQVIMTYDAFAGRLVAEHGLRLGFEADPTMISGATRYRLAARVVKDAAGPFEFISRLRPATVTERVLRLDAELQQHLATPEQLDKHARDYLLALEAAPRNNRGNVYADVQRAILYAQERLELASLVREYQQLKARLGLVEFADQMAVAARLAAEVPAVSAVLRSSFQVVLLDEYQDTSAAQAILLRSLFSGPVPSSGRGHPVTAVGDPFQAIYGWRGAAASNILQFARDFPRQDGRPSARYGLTVNRRSGPTILAVANELSRPLRARTAALAADAGAAPQEESELTLRAPIGVPAGQVAGATFETWQGEVSWIADQVAAARTDGTAPQWADIAILTRRNADIAPLYAELIGRNIPVEIVGLGGLLHLPEILDVTATLRLVNDVTANPDLIRLLTGPRWRIGPQDLALLGRRARDLAEQQNTDLDAGGAEGVLSALALAVAEIDPTEVVCLLDAVESPGDLGYSTAARARFARLAEELGYLRRHMDEPLLDLVRRVITTLGLDVEVMATPEFNRAARRDQLGAFLDAIAGYVDVDGEASLGGLLAYLQAEIDQGSGLDQAVPSDREAVKLLTVHKAKGLEWDVVFLPALVTGVFPSERVTDNWVTNPAVLPAELRGDAGSIPQLADSTYADMLSYKKDLSAEHALAEDRLAYVAVTRARRLLVGTGHWWRAELANPRVPSTYLRAILDEAGRQGGLVITAPQPAGTNPLAADTSPRPWPAPLDLEAAERRQHAAELVERARQRFVRTGSYDDTESADALLLDHEAIAAGWDADIDMLLSELTQLRARRQTVELPATLSASAVLRLHEDPERFAAELARPMPRRPSRAARFGTRFHQWVESHVTSLGSGRQSQHHLVDVDDLPDRADAGVADDEELRALCRSFAGGRFGNTVPYAVEAPFTMLVGDRLVRGRIDAVYRLTDADGPRYQVVDWKTNHADTADPLQLAIYRLAWAEVCGVAIGDVDAVFYYVRTDSVVRPSTLPDRGAIERLLAGT